MVNKLILAATSPGFVMVPGLFSLLLSSAGKKAQIEMDSPSHTKSSRGLLKSQVLLVKHIIKSIRSKEKKGILQQAIATVGWTSIHWLSKLKQPTLVLMGDQDLVTPAINAQLFKYRMPNVEVHVLPGDHFFLLPSAQRAASIMSSFLD